MEIFSWRGKPIPDIRAWAAERGERMVRYRGERYIPDLLSGQIVKEVEEGEMPQSFWQGLLMKDGWSYRELPE